MEDKIMIVLDEGVDLKEVAETVNCCKSGPTKLR